MIERYKKRDLSVLMLTNYKGDPIIRTFIMPTLYYASNFKI